MKSLTLFILLVCPYIFFGQDITIKLNNKTGFDLESVRFSDKYVGAIKKDSSVIILDCSELIYKDGKYAGTEEGVIIGKEKAPKQVVRCGTYMDRETKTKGSFEFDINYLDRDGYMLIWKQL